VNKKTDDKEALFLAQSEIRLLRRQLKKKGGKNLPGVDHAKERRAWREKTAKAARERREMRVKITELENKIEELVKDLIDSENELADAQKALAEKETKT